MNVRNGMRPIRRGFTILELLIVIGIILALGGLVLYNVIGAGEKADLKLVKVQIQSFSQALDNFKYDMKRLPTTEEGLRALVSKDVIEDEEDQSKWSGPYLKDFKPEDTWGHEWLYRAPSEISEDKPYDIISFGPDGQEGTDDDITNQDGSSADDASATE